MKRVNTAVQTDRGWRMPMDSRVKGAHVEMGTLAGCVGVCFQGSCCFKGSLL